MDELHSPLITREGDGGDHIPSNETRRIDDGGTKDDGYGDAGTSSEDKNDTNDCQMKVSHHQDGCHRVPMLPFTLSYFQVATDVLVWLFPHKNLNPIIAFCRHVCSVC